MLIYLIVDVLARRTPGKEWMPRAAKRSRLLRRIELWRIPGLELVVDYHVGLWVSIVDIFIDTIDVAASV